MQNGNDTLAALVEREAAAMSSRLQRWLRAKKWKQIDLARACDMDPSTVNGWLKGKPMGFAGMVAVAHAFGVDLPTFFTILPSDPSTELS